jgi:hypothetical protein
MATVTDDLDTVYQRRDGESFPLVDGYRTTTLAPDTKFIDTIRLEAVDALGRELMTEGELVSSHGTTGPSGTGLDHFSWTGARSGWGEDQSYAPPGWLEAVAEREGR